MSEAFIEKTPSSSAESTAPAPTPSLRESLLQENDIHIQSMQSGYGRSNGQQNQSQRPVNCQTPPCGPQPSQTAAPHPCPPASQTCQTPSQPYQTPSRTCRESCPPPCSEDVKVAYQAAMPYPLLKPQCRNPRYAAAMLDNMAGQNSELTAVSFYFYNQLIVGEYKELADTFFHINKVEMHHMQIFGNLAMQLGENPRMWSRKPRGGYQYWSPSCYKYPPFPIPTPKDNDCPCSEPPTCQAVKLLLSLAIEGEREAIKKYMHQTTCIQDINVCDNLRRISADEQLHLEILTRLYHNY